MKLPISNEIDWFLVLCAFGGGLFAKLFDLSWRFKRLGFWGTLSQSSVSFWMAFLIDPVFAGFLVALYTASGIDLSNCGFVLTPWFAAAIGLAGYSGMRLFQRIVELFQGRPGGGAEASDDILTWRDALLPADRQN